MTIVVSFVLDAFLSIDSEQKQADGTFNKLHSLSYNHPNRCVFVESQKSVTSKKYNVTLNTEDLLRSPSSNPEDVCVLYI